MTNTNVWIGKDNNGVIRGSLKEQPEVNYLGLTWEFVENYSHPDKKYELLKHITPSAVHKSLTSIDYKKDIVSGKIPQQVIELTNDGLLKSVDYILKDGVNNDLLVNVSDVYEYSQSDVDDPLINPSEYGIYSQTRTHRYYFEDGTLDLSDRVGSFKTKTKVYNTNRQALRIGRQRRRNIQVVLAENVGTVMIIFGIVDSSQGTSKAKRLAFNLLKDFSYVHSKDFSEYYKYATTDVYDSVTNEINFSWLDVKILTDSEIDLAVDGLAMTPEQGAQIKGALQLYKLTHMQGLTIREYMVEKLKGKIA